MRRFLVSLAPLALLTAAAAALLPSPAEAQRDPRLRWRTLTTAHFEVHYHDPLEPMARRVAAVAERAQRTLEAVLEHTPHERTHIVISDDSDSANGSATALPFNIIRLYATAPEDLSTLGDYDDWPTALVTHEHTHVLHLDQIGGIPALINAILGKVYAPNQVQPRWMLEGLAVYEESEHTSGGRIRSSVFEMFIRMDALEDRLLSIDQLSSSVDRWPHGNTWYLYGSRFVRWIADHYGNAALATISREYGRQLIPYGLNRIARRATGLGYTELYDRFLADMRTHFGEVRAEVEADGLVEGTRITHGGEEVRTPRFLRDGRVAYWVSDPTASPEIRFADGRTGAGATSVVRVGGYGAPAIPPDERSVYFSGSESHADIYFFNDLFRHDLASDETVRLTDGLRAQEPDVSPDGRTIAYTVNGAGTTHLELASVRDVPGTRRTLVRSRQFEQVYTPRWSPDGRTIAFSAWREGGWRDVLLVDVRTGRTTELTHDRALDTGPEWSPDGRVVYFSSDRTGIANIYAYELTSGVTRRVTNVLGGAFQPAVSHDGRRLVYVGYTSTGFDLYSMELDPSRFREAAPYVDTRPPWQPPPSGAAFPSEPYDPLPTLLPRAYLLDLTPDAFGQQLGISVIGGDVVGFHSYSLRMGIGLDRGDVTFDASYTYNRIPTAYSQRLFRNVSPRGGLRVGGHERRWLEDAWGTESRVSYSWGRALSYESVALSHSLAYLDKAEPFGGRLDPTTPPPQLPEIGWFSSAHLGWSHSTVERHTYDISPSRGRSISLDVGVSHPILGSRFRSVSTSWAFTQYLTMPWLDHHVLALRYGGGLSGGDLGRRGLYSVGGYPDASIRDGLIDNIVLGGVALRGYPAYDRAGTQFHLVQAEYRFPIVHIDRGVETLPVYLNRAYGTLFVDWGDAFYGHPVLADFRFGIGAELFVDFTLGYFLQFTLRIGAARGLSEGGATQFYAHLGVPF